MKLIKILVINVKLREEVEPYSFFRRIDEKMYRLSCRQKSALRQFTTVTYPLYLCTKPNYILLNDIKIRTFKR